MYKNAIAIMVIAVAKIASINRIPVLSSKRNINTSHDVINIATQIGKLI